MTTLFSILRLGQSGLQASSFGTSIASQNAANVATDGYSRRLSATTPLGPPGSGVRNTGGQRVIDSHLEQRLLGARTFQGEANARATTLSVLDTIVFEGPGSIGQAIDDFEESLADLANYPDEPAVRYQLLQRSAQLATVFNRTAAELDQVRGDTNDRVASLVGEVNRKLEEIAALGGDIVTYENGTGLEASDLRDRRDQLVREVADAIPVTVIPETNGAISLLLAGSKKLVGPDGEVNPLITSRDPGTGDVSIFVEAAGVNEDVTSLITSGAVGGFLAGRDGGLRDAIDALDALAVDITDAYNAAHSAGIGLDGGTGRNLFEPLTPGAGAAAAFAVSTDVLGQPDRIAAATDAAALPGDNRNALLLVALASTDIALGGTATASGAFGSLVSSAGSSAQRATNLLDFADNALQQVASLRESISGVNTDEEIINLTQYQRAYQASLRVITTADEMLAELLSLKR